MLIRWLLLSLPLLAQDAPVQAYSGARLLDGNGGPAVENATLVVSKGRIVAAGPARRVRVPANALEVDLRGKTIIPGLVNAHAHVSDVQGIAPPAYTEANVRRQLGVYARYGVTSVWSLGGEKTPAFAVRDAQNQAGLEHARLFVAGEVITAATAAEAREKVRANAARKPDVIKIRVDDQLGTAAKMPPAIYEAVIDEAHRQGLRLAAHIFSLEDAKGVLRSGADFIAHSVRDREIDDEFLRLLKSRSIAYCPTLTREVSAFAYETEPAFFSDPFFLREADAAVVAQLKEPARQQAMAQSNSARAYKSALPVAMRNLKRAADAGVIIAMGTDSGAFANRFQGFFEHLEMEMMAEAGLTPAQILRAAGADAARAMGVKDVGTLAPGNWADFVVLKDNPLQDIRNTRAIESVYIAGRRVTR